MEKPAESEGSDEPAYSYKPSLMGAAWMFRLTPSHLAWTKGYQSGQVPYRDIASIRMSFRPVTMQARRYLTEIWAPGTPKLIISSASWKSMVEQQSLAAPYSELVLQLHRAVAAAGGQPQCASGMHPLLYWPGLLIYVAVLLGLAGLIVRALQVSSYPGALFVVAFMGFFAWQLGYFFKLNKPARYSVEAPPQDMLPRA